MSPYLKDKKSFNNKNYNDDDDHDDDDGNGDSPRLPTPLRFHQKIMNLIVNLILMTKN